MADIANLTTMTNASFAAGVSLHVLDEGGIVLCENSQSIYELNRLSALIWLGLEENPSLQDAADAVSQKLNIGAPSALTYVHDSVASWWEPASFWPLS